MTAAEKMRRYRARKFGNKPVTKSPAATVAQLETRIRELEVELARARAARGKTQHTANAQKFFPGLYAVQTRTCAFGGASTTRAEPAFVATARWKPNVPTDGYVLRRGPKDYVVLSVRPKRYRSLEDAMVQVPARVEP